MKNLDFIFSICSDNVILKILKSFEYATGLKVIILDKDGNTRITEKNDTCRCRFCTLINATRDGHKKCRDSYVKAGEQSSLYGAPYIFRCHAGLVAFASPIIINGEYIGMVICRNMLMWERDGFFNKEIELMNRDLGINLQELIECTKELPVVSANKVQAAATLLFSVMNHILQSDFLEMKHRQEIAHHEAMLNEEIKEKKALKKDLERMTGKIYGGYKLQKEKELLGKIKTADPISAKKILLSYIVQIREKNTAHFEIFRVKIFELLFVIAREVAEMGVSMAEIDTLSAKFIHDLYLITEVDELSNAAEVILSAYMELVTLNRPDLKNMQIVESAAAFIRENYHKNITLNDVAEAVFISQFYLSRLFKEVLNCTVGEYITKVKMEHAKRLMHNPKNTLSDIANRLNYVDSSYFSKVFKKYEGVTPSQYRKKLL
ncbi:MAG: PocR ligand-binding domain-containing protein [Eubacterium sp.]